MKTPCEVIRDLIPLYADEVCSVKSRELVEEHCKECAECKNALDAAGVPLPEAKIDSLSQQPLRKTKRHYLRLAIITAVICAALVYPLLMAGMLTVNEIMGNPKDSWTYMFARNDIERFVDHIKDGKSEKAMELIGIERFDGKICSESDSVQYRKDISEVFNNFFSVYPITSYQITPYNSNTVGELKFVALIDLDRNAAAAPVEVQLYFTKKIDKKLYFSGAYVCGDSETDPKTIEMFAPQIEAVNKQLGGIMCVGQAFTEKLDYALRNGNYSEIPDIIRTHEYLRYRAYSFEIYGMADADEERRLNKINNQKRDEYCEKFSRDMKALFADNYKYSSISGSAPEYDLNAVMAKDTAFEYTSGFSQDITINMSGYDGESFSVSFTALVAEYAQAPFSDITYSDNTPEEFKAEFERLLG